MRHFARFDPSARSQAGIYGDYTAVYGEQARRPEGVWIAQEWYFPEALDAGNSAYCWINVWDFHSIDGSPRGNNRWHTSPGLFIHPDGSMRLLLRFNGPGENVNGIWSIASSKPMPVGRWFDIEVHYEWVDTKTGTIRVWFDGELVIEKSGVQTRESSHTIPEFYMKFYGARSGECGGWTPTPSLKYTRNVRIAGERIWRD